MDGEAKSVSLGLDLGKTFLKLRHGDVVEFTFAVKALGNTSVAQKVPLGLEFAKVSNERRVIAQLCKNVDKTTEGSILEVFAGHGEWQLSRDTVLRQLERLGNVELQFLLDELAARECMCDTQVEVVGVHVRSNVLLCGGRARR